MPNASKSFPDQGSRTRPPRAGVLGAAIRAVVEHLEGRQLLAADPFANENDVQSVPFVLEFDGSGAVGLHDKDGEHIGFTRVQVNKNGRTASYVQANLDRINGQLKITTTGTSTAGSNYNNDNTLTNAVETQFNGSTSGFSITTRLIGPMTYIAEPSEQAGISFGPDQDNYVKLVAIARQEGPRLQFVDEQLVSGNYNHVLDALRDIGSFASINSLDLRIVGDAATGKITAFYSVNGGSFQKFTQELTLTGTRKAAFFSTTARAGLIAAHKNNNGAITATFDRFEIQPGTPVAARPTVASVNPANAATHVPRDQFVSAQLNLTGGGVASASLSSATVRLYRTSDHQVIPANVGTSGGGDVIILTPATLLEANTNYTFEVTDGLLDVAGNAFVPFSSNFTTGTTGGEVDPSFSFEKIAINTATGEKFTALAVGPDRRLYAGTVEGRIYRFTINNTTGALGAPQVLDVVRNANGGSNRLLTGLVFQPGSTAQNPILWVTHGQYRFGTDPNGTIDENQYADDWTGKISKITNLGGNNTGTLTDVVTNLPRSVRDHLTNQPSFGPDGALYIPQGSNSAGGAPDAAWGNRPERLLSGAILRLDPSGFSSTTNVKTADGGTYNPFATGAKLTIYATGVRNAYDLVWTGDGFLYAPTNGTAAGANTPAGPGVPGLTNIGVQHDFLFRITNGGYYGHPNPLRSEYVHGAGYTPADGVGPAEVPEYGSTIQPDSDYQGFAYDFNVNVSPNGVIEYRNATHFGGNLAGKLLVVRYSGPDDVMVLTKDASGAIVQAQKGISGLGGFVDPLDIIEDPVTGFLYVSEYAERDPDRRKITLLRPIPPGANATANKPRLVFTDIATGNTNGSGATAAQTVTITNTGTSILSIPGGGVSIVDDPAVSGNHTAEFEPVNWPTLPANIAVGESISFQVRFRAAATSIRAALLRIQSNDSTGNTLDINLRGIGTTSDGGGEVSGSHEPSLQRILNAFQLPINVGDANGEDTFDLPTPRPAGTVHDEIEMQRLEKAGAGPVRIEPLAEYAFNTTKGFVAHVGYYSPGTRDAKTELFRVNVSERTSVNPTWAATFDPGSAPFALYGEFTGNLFEINGLPRGVYSEDVFNQWDAANRKKVRFFPLKNPDGSTEPNAYVFAFEEYTSGYDSNDIVGVIRNVKPAANGPEIGTQNLDRQPSTEAGGSAVRVLNPTLLTFNRIQLDPPSPIPDNVVHDEAKLRIRNSGDAPLTINSLNLTGANPGSFQLVSPPSAGTVIDAGGFVDVTVRFVATSGRIRTATLAINSDDADESVTNISLAGYWQNRSENNEEPMLPEFMQLFGLSTQVAYANEQFKIPGEEGRVRRTGDEVLSPFWRRANSAAAVELIQLAAYHTQGNTATVKWHFASSFTTTDIFTHAGVDGQSILPRSNGGSQLASGTFKPANQGSDTNPAFGFRIDSEWSDPTRNPQEQSGGGYGHHVRFWVAKDSAGNVIPNTYVMGMDYSGINYDYQDNLYLVRNLVPVSGPGAPTNAQATASSGGIFLDWNNNTEANLAGYNVYRGSTAGFTPGSGNKQNSTGLLTQSDFNDIFAPTGVTSYYKISAVDTAGNESGFASASATRGSDTTPPAMPANLLVTGSATNIALDWNNNAEVDLAGYDVLRSTSLNGTYVKQNTNGLLGTSSYIDSTAQEGVTYFYRVYAVDGSGNSSDPATGSGTRQAPTVDPPANPSGLGATAVSATQINLAWSASANATSYRIERRVLGAATFDEITSGVSSTSFQDTTVNPSTTYEYRVRAENSAGLSPGYSNIAQAATPAPASFIGTAIGTTGSHVTITDGVAYDVTSSGAGITGNSDQFYLLSRSVTGDFDVKVRIADITGGNSLSRAGIMARASLSATSAHAFVSASKADGFRSARRLVEGGSTTTTKTGTPAFPNAWVRLQRVGNVFTAYYGSNGTSWTQIFSQTIALPLTLNLGLASSAYHSTQTGNFALRDFGDTNATAPAPGVPGNLSATGVSPSQVDLSWDAASNATSYRVERKGPGDADFVEIAANVTGTTYQDTGRAANTSYEYRVRAVGAPGVFSGYSNVATGTTQPLAPPAAPSDLDAVAVSHNQINLSWNAAAGATSYRIERRILGAATFDEIASGVTATSFQDTGRTPETTYEYQVRAENAGGLSATYSNIDSATTPAAPVAPAYLAVNINAPSSGSTTALPGGTGFDIVSGGGNIQSTSDGFHFAYRQITGDFDIIAQLTNLTDTNGSPKAGLMARSSLTANSANVYSHVASNGYRISRRISTGAGTDIVSNGGINSYPNTWLRLRRVGDVFSAMRSTDGVNWTAIGTYTQGMPATLFVGMAVTAQSSTQTTTANFRNVADFNETPPSAPAAPALNGSASSATQVNLAWNVVATATSYRVERKGPGDADFVEIASNVTATNYSDAGRTADTSYDYRVRAENAAGPSPYSNVVTVLTPSAPAPTTYQTADIATTLTSTTNALPDGTSFDTVASGSNIQNTSDSFHFVYREITGDFDIKAQIASMSDTNNSPKAGLMARTSLAADSANVYAHIASNGYRVSRRATAGANTEIISANNFHSFPNTWVRLRRVGNTFTAFRSTDGVAWVTIGSYTQDMPATLLVGMATTAQSSTQTTSVQYRNVGDVTP